MRDCNKCVYSTRDGNCRKWECKGTVTVEDIKKEAKEECGEELLKIINEKPYGTEKNNWWLISQIKHFCFGVPRICDKKEHK